MKKVIYELKSLEERRTLILLTIEEKIFPQNHYFFLRNREKLYIGTSLFLILESNEVPLLVAYGQGQPSQLKKKGNLISTHFRFETLHEKEMVNTFLNKTELALILQSKAIAIPLLIPDVYFVEKSKQKIA